MLGFFKRNKINIVAKYCLIKPKIKNFVKKEAISCGVNVNFRTVFQLAKPAFFSTLKTLQQINSFKNDFVTIS